ncbi:MAG: type II secretion system inner membrane protein GspF [Myxococcales bacterium]|nr:type II secretion system inner membrane protein GspF [Myxococcales bacterium]
MPSFAYRGLDARGKNVAGTRDADNPRVLRSTLRREGIFVTDVNEAHQKVKRGSGLGREVDLKGAFDRVKLQDVAVLTRQLATLLKAGIPLSEALAALVDQSDSAKLSRAIGDIRTKVNEGTPLADAMANHPKIFTDLYVNMVRAGEAAGNLDQVLARLSQFLDAQVKLRGKVKSALTYPIIMAIIGIGITAMLMVVVVPKITQIFGDTGKALPWNTRLLMWGSDVIGSWWWLLIILIAGAIFGFRYWKKTPSGKKRWDRITLRLWVVGGLVRMIAIARFARTVGTMLRSGVPLLQTLEISKAIVGNSVLVDVVEDARVAIREGDNIADPLARSKQFPPVVTRMIAVGERSGQLEGMLETVAEAYENEVDLRLGRLTTLMEPLIILVMGGSVAFIVFSILMPILDMNELVG